MVDPFTPPPRILNKTPSMRVREIAQLVPEALEEKCDSAKAVEASMATLKSRDSSAKDKWSALRILLFLTFEDPNSSSVAWYLAVVLFVAIVVNCAAFISGSVKSLQVRPTTCDFPVCVPGTPGAVCTEMVCPPIEKPALWHLEFWTIVIFSIDYLVRVICVHGVPMDLIRPRSLNFTVDGKLKDRSARAEHGPVRKTLKYMCSWLNIVDLISIIPFYLSMSMQNSRVTKDLGVMRVLRLMRVMRVLKLGKYSEGGLIIGRTIRASLPALVLFVFLTTILTIVFGSFMYYFEGGMFEVTEAFPHGGFLRWNARRTAQEETPFTSIVMGMYWVVVNTTTLGNCNMYPTTVMGRVCSCIVAYLGIISLALPIAITGKNFTEQYNMVYGKVGGLMSAAPSETAAVNHESMVQRTKEMNAAAQGMSTASTIVHPPKSLTADSSSSSSFAASQDPSVPELQTRMARLELEMEALKNQLRSVTQAQQQNLQ